MRHLKHENIRVKSQQLKVRYYKLTCKIEGFSFGLGKTPALKNSRRTLEELRKSQEKMKYRETPLTGGATLLKLVNSTFFFFGWGGGGEIPNSLQNHQL